MFLASHTQLLLPGTGMGCLDSTTEVKGMGSSHRQDTRNQQVKWQTCQQFYCQFCFYCWSLLLGKVFLIRYLHKVKAEDYE